MHASMLIDNHMHRDVPTRNCKNGNFGEKVFIFCALCLNFNPMRWSCWPMEQYYPKLVLPWPTIDRYIQPRLSSLPSNCCWIFDLKYSNFKASLVCVSMYVHQNHGQLSQSMVVAQPACFIFNRCREWLAVRPTPSPASVEPLTSSISPWTGRRYTHCIGCNTVF